MKLNSENLDGFINFLFKLMKLVCRFPPFQRPRFFSHLNLQDELPCFQHVLFCHLYTRGKPCEYLTFTMLKQKANEIHENLRELHLTQVACCLKYDSWCVLYS